MLFIDFETYYDKDYSLKKMPTMQYIRDPRFRLLGAAIWQSGDKEITWLDEVEVHRQLPKICYKHRSAVAHNAYFDAAVLSEVFGIRIPWWYDTMLMARWYISQGGMHPDQTTSLEALAAPFGYTKGDTGEAIQTGGEELADYAKHDLKMTMLLYHFFKRIGLPPHEELSYMNIRIKAAAEPMLSLNKELLHKVANRQPSDLAVKLRKNEHFVKVLKHYGVEPEYKTSPRTGKQTLATAKTDEFMQRLQRHENPKVRKIVQLRMEGSSNINQTRAQRFLDIGEPFPLPLLYYAAHTGRDGGMDKINPQNLPRGGELRRAIEAPPGHKLVIVDSSQIEVRTLAWLAGCHTLLNVFHSGDDPYRQFAGDVLYRKPPSEITKPERNMAKPPVLACGYGQSANGLIQYAEGMGINLDRQMADRAVKGYRNKYFEIVRYWDSLMNQVQKYGELELPNKRKLIYPDRYWHGRTLMYKRPQIFSKTKKGQRDHAKIWGGLLAENITQAVARDVVFEQARWLSYKWPVVLSIHDEVILCVPDNQAEQALEDALEAFKTAPAWAADLPVEGEGEVFKNYAKEL